MRYRVLGLIILLVIALCCYADGWGRGAWGGGTDQMFIFESTIIADAGLYDGMLATFNSGGSTIIAVGREGKGTRRMISYDDISTIPAEALITVAEFSVWCTYFNSTSGPVNVQISAISVDWIEGTHDGMTYEHGSCSWNNQGYGIGVAGTTIPPADSAWTAAGGDFESPDDTVTITAAGSRHIFHIETIIQAAVQSGVFYGFHLKHTNEALDNSYAFFASSENATEAYWPELHIEYLILREAGRGKVWGRRAWGR